MENSGSSQGKKGHKGHKGQLLQPHQQAKPHPQPSSNKKYYIIPVIFVLGAIVVLILMIFGIIPNPIRSNNSTANNSINCDGDWEPCSPSCGNGTMKYKIKTNKQGNGTSCPENDGASKSCKIKDCPVNCVGEWEPCSTLTTCGSGTEIYKVRTIKKGDGIDCPHVTGFSRTCKIKDCILTATPTTGYNMIPFTDANKNVY